MSQMVELPDDVMAIVAAEASAQGRSVPEQIRHWVLIGRLAETLPSYSYHRLLQMLAKSPFVMD